MQRALDAARHSALRGEVPVGALIIDPRGAVLSCVGNHPISASDPTAHAEMIALREAARRKGNYRLMGCTLYVTLEPCTMCAGAISHARIERLVYGARDLKGGAVESGVRFFDAPTCHWRPSLLGGVSEEECAALLKDFFRARRS
jgi:tRNA(adenine34) deaminase